MPCFRKRLVLVFLATVFTLIVITRSEWLLQGSQSLLRRDFTKNDTTNNDNNDNNNSDDDWKPSRSVCYAIGACTACTPDELDQDNTCKLTGFKESIVCKHPNSDSETKDFRECQPPSEKFYFFKFATLNVMTALASAFVIIWRKRKQTANQAERLTRRITAA